MECRKTGNWGLGIEIDRAKNGDCNLFSRLAQEIGENLGYPYPMEYEQKMREYLSKVAS
ncbi:aminoglycoside 6-adenylyltransferase [Mesobacillus boroniphilus]|uniref:aminoglycoside 6-adenylyltransferase n=1 Tax=Mesobacillus boroniphilus TaxID=308892 RepID=UPI0011DE145E